MDKFQNLPYARPDMEQVKAAYLTLTQQLNEAQDYAQAKEAYFALQDVGMHLSTTFSIAHVRNTINTADDYYGGEVAWLKQEMANLMPLTKAWNQALVHCKFRADFEKEYGAQLFRLLDGKLKTEDPAIIEETIEEGKIQQAYQKLTALAHTTFRGEECNFYGLLKHMQSTDRATREEAFHRWADLYASIADQLDDQYSRLVELRDTMAKKLGFPNYTQMAYLARRRFDYTAEDVASFRKQVKELIVPAVARYRKGQAKRLGVEKLKYYDETLTFPQGNANPIGDKDFLIDCAKKMYHSLSEETGEFFDFMTEYELFDLETKPNKRMGGYCTGFPAYKAPFIFSNFNGTSADVDVLTHEAGHAFQGYLGMRSIPVSALKGSTSEINEIHSMAMEHFAYPWMKDFFGDNSEKYLYSHLMDALCVIPYMVCVDEFQHKVYAKPTMTPMERRAAWHELETYYMPWRDYDEEPFLTQGGFWMQKQHVFLYPFYYIDYALAQICSFELYGRMKKDPDAAWQDYLQLCRMGGTKGYFELLDSAKLHNPFKDGSVASAVGHVIDELGQSVHSC